MRHGHEHGMGYMVSMALGQSKARHIAWHDLYGINQKQGSKHVTQGLSHKPLRHEVNAKGPPKEALRE